MAKVNDLAGLVFHELTVLVRVENSDGRAQWKCLCSCGAETNVLGKSLKNGNTKSCGHLTLQRFVERNTRHGHCTGGRSRTYKVWQGMWQRCSNTKHKHYKHYKHYGGRGIVVCEEWMRFENFLEDMGERPLSMTLDRINVDGGYEKDNCRWVEWDVQVENKRRNRREEQ